MRNINDLRMGLKEALDNLWLRITGQFSAVNDRVGTLDNRVDDLEDAVDGLDGGMIKSISFNGTNVPKDAQGNVALQETDPTVPAWAKQQKAKTSDFTNDGEDGQHPYITAQDVTVPTKTSDLINDGNDGTSYYVTRDMLGELGDQAIVDENHLPELTPYYIGYEFNHDIHIQGQGILVYISPAGMEVMLASTEDQKYASCTFRGLAYTQKQNLSYDDYNVVGWMDGPGVHELITGYIDHIPPGGYGDDEQITFGDIQSISGGGGGGGGGDVNIIEAISFNGTNVPPDSGKRVSLTETDPTVPAWAKAQTKPTYTAQEVGAQTDVGLYIDAQGYLCQQIGSDT